MISLEEAEKNVGREVIYTPYEGCDSSELQYGHIHSVGSRYIFVSFGSRTPGRAEACRPDDLEFSIR